MAQDTLSKNRKGVFMTKPLRWGILGAAKFAREHMAPAMM